MIFKLIVLLILLTLACKAVVMLISHKNAHFTGSLQHLECDFMIFSQGRRIIFGVPNLNIRWCQAGHQLIIHTC